MAAEGREIPEDIKVDQVDQVPAQEGVDDEVGVTDLYSNHFLFCDFGSSLLFLRGA